MKKILGLDLGVGSIGWALVNEAEQADEKSSIIKLGVRVNPLTVDEQTNFEKGKPITTTAQSANTLNSSSAPLITKKRAKSGEVHLSERTIKSSDSGQILQKIVPSIIHTSNDEKLICTGPIWKSIIDSATVRNTNVIVILSLFVFELNIFSNCVKIHPMIAPRAREAMISSIGFTMIETKSTAPLTSDFEIPKQIAKTMRPTASSNATIGRRSFVRGPFALY